MRSNEILDHLEALGDRIVRGQDLAPEELRALIRLRSGWIARLNAAGLDGLDPGRLTAVFQQGAEAERRMGAYRDSLRRQVQQAERERRLLGDLRQSLPAARANLDLEA